MAKQKQYNYPEFTPEMLNEMMATKQAKAWGYKSISAAKKDGYNTRRVSADLREIADFLQITREEVASLVRDWQMNDLVSYTCHADLNCIYFKNTY